MAVELGNEMSEKLKARQDETTKLRLRIAKLALAGISAIVIIAGIFGAIGKIGKLSEGSERYSALEAEFEEVKAVAAQHKAEAESEQDPGGKPANTVDKDMYSAWASGEKVAALLNKAYMEDGLELLADRDEYKALCNGDASPLWFGGDMNPRECPLEWRFLTWYDSANREYDTVFGCYAEGSRGTYLLAVRYALYNGEGDTFSLSSTYVTTYGKMYATTGKIEDDSNEIGEEISDMAGQLAGDGGESGGGDDAGDTSQDGGYTMPGAPSHGGGTTNREERPEDYGNNSDNGESYGDGESYDNGESYESADDDGDMPDLSGLSGATA